MFGVTGCLRFECYLLEYLKGQGFLTCSCEPGDNVCMCVIIRLVIWENVNMKSKQIHMYTL